MLTSDDIRTLTGLYTRLGVQRILSDPINVVEIMAHERAHLLAFKQRFVFPSNSTYRQLADVVEANVYKLKTYESMFHNEVLANAIVHHAFHR